MLTNKESKQTTQKKQRTKRARHRFSFAQGPCKPPRRRRALCRAVLAQNSNKNKYKQNCEQLRKHTDVLRWSLFVFVFPWLSPSIFVGWRCVGPPSHRKNRKNRISGQGKYETNRKEPGKNHYCSFLYRFRLFPGPQLYFFNVFLCEDGPTQYEPG